MRCPKELQESCLWHHFRTLWLGPRSKTAAGQAHCSRWLVCFFHEIAQGQRDCCWHALLLTWFSTHTWHRPSQVTSSRLSVVYHQSLSLNHACESMYWHLSIFVLTVVEWQPSAPKGGREAAGILYNKCAHDDGTWALHQMSGSSLWMAGPISSEGF